LEHKLIVSVVYLSGPMENLTKEEMNGWRDKSERFFSGYNIDVINPVRTPTQINDKIIVRRDKQSIDLSDALLVNLEHVDFNRIRPKIIDKLRDFRKNGWINPKNMVDDLIELFNAEHVKAFGTIMEIIYAYNKNKPIVVVINKNWNVDRLPTWLRYHVDFATTDIKEALEYIVSINKKRVRKEHLPEKEKTK